MRRCADLVRKLSVVTTEVQKRTLREVWRRQATRCCSHRDLSIPEEAKYLAAAPDLLAAVAALPVDSGLRPEECFRLRGESTTWFNRPLELHNTYGLFLLKSWSTDRFVIGTYSENIVTRWVECNLRVK
jgi:hypothetical protein